VIPSLASLPPYYNQARFFEHLQVEHDGASVQVVEVITQLTGRFGADPDSIEDRASVGVCDGLENTVVIRPPAGALAT
jgi:hypothetical protein